MLIRFVLGGAIVSAFAFLGELLEPKTLSGVFGAAPSVAIATLALAFRTHSPEHVATEARAMIIGCAALLIYCMACVALVKGERLPVWMDAGVAWLVWCAIALGAWLPLHPWLVS